MTRYKMCGRCFAADKRCEHELNGFWSESEKEVVLRVQELAGAGVLSDDLHCLAMQNNFAACEPALGGLMPITESVCWPSVGATHPLRHIGLDCEARAGPSFASTATYRLRHQAVDFHGLVMKLAHEPGRFSV